ncbi:hypothetical protein C2U70_19445 [Bradyrhizobium guangdongense]|uniref:hypothetical protein n=1 Tax=Bradyrhizobium guangdongense TaxID=1325090 RepID=UPI00112E8E89|nr:hypothetical protein [Bradyrhizobium guangdongense]TPQ33375.1 hypothetical protein C2U70_19445 [Bradyrhizobium guangdongense]
MNHRGVEFTVAKTAIPGVWQWQFQIGDKVKSGKTETKIDLLAVRRVQLRIDRELKAIGETLAGQGPLNRPLEPDLGALGPAPVRRGTPA